jgi:16S rRNA A1518/A1519 N6-dimethyltransferase RsmA/KsgA/DIM1 with predicted DNA glycosylase/AP lyase activity
MIQLIKQCLRPLVKPILGERVVAKINYKRGVRLKASWEGVFNKQHGRKEIFDEIVEHFDPATIVETGTFRGTTTEYMSGTTANVFSLEFDPSNAGYAQARLAKFKNVQVINLDSRSGHKHLIRTKKLPSN